MKEGMKILVAYDGSSLAKKALNEAIGLARTYGGSITALHVDPFEPADSNRTVKEEKEHREGMLRALSREIEPDLKKSKIQHELMSEHSDDVPGTIIETVSSGGFDLIAIGSRGLGRTKAPLLGSVSRRVVTEATCDVLVIKSDSA